MDFVVTIGRRILCLYSIHTQHQWINCVHTEEIVLHNIVLD